MKVYKSKISRLFDRPVKLNEFLKKLTKLTDSQLIDAALKGALWLQKGGKGKILKIRSLESDVNGEDVVSLYFDPKVLRLPEFSSATCVYESKNYGVWIKPAGILAQGTETGDHASLLRYVEKKRGKEVYLVHRLDRETAGLMLIAYHPKAAAELSSLFQNHKIEKKYEAVVLGELKAGQEETINLSLDDKKAITHYKVLESGEGISKLEITLETGRFHQIRRHLELIGHPIMGDPKYGRGNKNQDGLKLRATVLAFLDPWDNEKKQWSLS